MFLHLHVNFVSSRGCKQCFAFSKYLWHMWSCWFHHRISSVVVAFCVLIHFTFLFAFVLLQTVNLSKTVEKMKLFPSLKV